MVANNISTGVRIKDSKIDIRIGIGRMEKATETDRVRGFPYLENTVNFN
jgi:hypothetical protein